MLRKSCTERFWRRHHDPAALLSDHTRKKVCRGERLTNGTKGTPTRWVRPLSAPG